MQIFRAIISGTLDELGDILGCSAECLMRAFDEKVNQFFTQSLQLTSIPCDSNMSDAGDDAMPRQFEPRNLSE